MFPPKVTVRIFDFYQMRGDFIFYNWMLLDMVFNLLADMKMIIHKKCFAPRCKLCTTLVTVFCQRLHLGRTGFR